MLEAHRLKKLPSSIKRQYEDKGPNCPILDAVIENLSDFFSIFSSVIQQTDEIYWFRGHANFTWEIKPSALRQRKQQDREKALNLIDNFKRYIEFKLPKAPLPHEYLKWMQLAQHYARQI